MDRVTIAVLTSPKQFFDDEDRLESALPPLLVVLALAVVSLSSLLPAYLRVLETRPLPDVASVSLSFGGTAMRLSGISASVVAVVVVAPFAAWILHGGALYLLSMPFASDGSFRRTLLAVGWGYLPQIGASAVTLLATVAVSLTASGTVPAALRFTLAGNSTVQGTTVTPLYAGAELLGLLATIWSGYIWYGGLRSVRGLSGRQAALVAGAVVFLIADTSIVRELLA